MKQVIQLLKKELIVFFNDKVAVAMTFIVPLFLILIFGAVFGGTGGGVRGLRLALVNESDAPIAKKLVKTLDESDNFRIIKNYTDGEGQTIAFDHESVQDYVRGGKVRAALVIPVDAYTDTSTALKLKFYYDPRNEIEMQMIQGLLQQTIFSEIPSVFMQSMQRQTVAQLGELEGTAFNSEIASAVSRYFGVDSADVMTPLTSTDWEMDMSAADSDSAGSNSGGGGDIFSNILDLEKIQLVGEDIVNPQVTRSVGGWAIMFLLFTLTASSAALFDEKKSGVVLRILAAPISRTHILWSKYLFNIGLGMMQLLVMFVFGWLIHDIDIFSNFFNLILVCLAAAAASTAFGMLLAAYSSTPAQANGLGTFLILGMSATGGAWFPTFLMPDYIQIVSKFTLVYWAMEGFMKVLWSGVGTVEILPELAVLLLMAAVVIGISLRRFNKGHIF